jgi:hypothetical protein
MWRPLVFRRPWRFRSLCRLEPLRQRIDPGPQRPDLLLLPVNHIAQFDVGTLQEGDFRFDLLDCIAVHFDSVNPEEVWESSTRCRR